MWSKLSWSTEEWNASRKVPAIRWLFQLTFQTMFEPLLTLKQSSERWLIRLSMLSSLARRQKRSKTSRFLTKSHWSDCPSAKSWSQISLGCSPSGCLTSMIKRSSQVAYSTRWEKCLQWSKTSYTMYQQVRSIMPSTRLYQQRILLTSTTSMWPTERSSWGQLPPLSKERWATTLNTEEERVCMKRSIIRLDQGTQTAIVKAGLIRRTYTWDHLWSIRESSSLSSSREIRMSSCITIRRPRNLVHINRTWRVCKFPESSKPSSLTITGSPSSRPRSLTQPSWHRLRDDLGASIMTVRCREHAWRQRASAKDLVNLMPWPQH